MVIKDAQYWKEYNQKRKAYIQQKNKERYNQDKGCINATNSEKIQPINTTKTDTTFNTTDTTSTDTTEAVVLKTDTTDTNKANLQPCPNCLQLEKTNSRLRQKADDCNKRHTIPKDADVVGLMWDKRYKKFIFYGCASSCWAGKYCNNCSSLEQQIIKRINQKHEANQ